MTGIFSTHNMSFDKLKPNDDTDFQMEQLLSQPFDASYPPVLYIYDHKKIYEKIDAGEDVTDYIDYEMLEAMKSDLDQYKPDEKLIGSTLIYKNIIEVWG